MPKGERSYVFMELVVRVITDQGSFSVRDERHQPAPLHPEFFQGTRWVVEQLE